MKATTGIMALLVLGSLLALGIAEILSGAVTVNPIYEQMFLGLGVFALLAIAYGILDQKRSLPPAPPPVTEEPKPEQENQPAMPAPAPSPESGLSAAFQQLRTYIDLEMWELALDRANHILENHPNSREAMAIERNINDLRWKAEPKFVERGKTTVSDAEARRLKIEGLSRFVQHIRTYMELEMWELAKQKASSLMKNFPESDAAKEVGRLWPEIERNLRQPTGAGAPE